MYELAKAWLFRKDAEQAHELTLNLLSRYAHTPLAMFWRQKVSPKPVKVMGITFPNPIGLAAGLIKMRNVLRLLRKWALASLK